MEIKEDLNVLGNIKSPLFKGTATHSQNTDKLDNLNSTQFLRSDQDDTFIGNLTIFGNIKANFFDGKSKEADLSTNSEYAKVAEHSETSETTKTFNYLKMEQFIRSDDNGKISGNLEVTGDIKACSFIGTATNSDTLNGLYASQFLRNDTDNNILGSLSVRDEVQAKNISTSRSNIVDSFTSKNDIEPGYVVSISKDDEYQVDKCNKDDIPVGIVSRRAGIVLGSKNKGLCVTLLGKESVYIIGPIKKGQPVTVYDNGVCCLRGKDERILGVSLETNLLDTVKLIKIFIK